MSLLRNIKDKALKQGASLAKGELAKGVTDLFNAVEKAIPDRDGLSSGSLKFQTSLAAEEALKIARTRESDLLHLGEWGVTALFAELGSGDDKAALLVYLQESAGWDELFDAVDNAREADAQEERDSRARIAAAKSILADIAGAAKVLLPFVLGVVGL